MILNTLLMSRSPVERRLDYGIAAHILSCAFQLTSEPIHSRYIDSDKGGHEKHYSLHQDFKG